jgi:hypothetical protein
VFRQLGSPAHLHDPGTRVTPPTQHQLKFHNENCCSNLESQITQLQAQIALHQERIVHLNEVESTDDSALAALQTAVEKISILSPEAIASFKAAVLDYSDIMIGRAVLLQHICEGRSIIPCEASTCLARSFSIEVSHFMNSREVTLTIPLSITVRIGTSPEASMPSERSTFGSAEEAARPRSYYEGYKGYDPDFLVVLQKVGEMVS